jgi:hypothetical protein
MPRSIGIFLLTRVGVRSTLLHSAALFLRSALGLLATLVIGSALLGAFIAFVMRRILLVTRRIL